MRFVLNIYGVKNYCIRNPRSNARHGAKKLHRPHSTEMNTEIIYWLQQQHPWLQEAARRLAANYRLSERDIHELSLIIKDSGIAAPATPLIEVSSGAVATAAELRLISIGPVRGIDALCTRSPLSFGSENLTVVYGHNGSGKSGYTRILSKACGKPHGRNLRSNVFASSPTSQTCTIGYSSGETNHEIEWTPGSPLIEALSIVDVFDTASGELYIESETEATFIPSTLVLFADLVSACGKVESLLDAELRALVCGLPAMPHEFSGTAAELDYRKISHTWTDLQISTYTGWSAADEQELKTINGMLAVADPIATAQKKRLIKLQRESLALAVEAALKQLTGSGFEDYSSKFIAAAKKRLIAREAAEALKEKSSVEGVGSDTWKSMWEAARKFASEESYPFSPFPPHEPGDRCVFCHQTLNEDARQRLTSFERYVSGQMETDATHAENALADYLKKIVTRPTTVTLQTSAQAAELDAHLTSLLENVWVELEKNLIRLRSGLNPDLEYTKSDDVNSLLESLRLLAISAEEEASGLTRSATPETRRAADTRRKELRAKKWISEQSASVRVEVQRLKQVNEYQAWKRQTNTTTISRKAGDLSETLVTDAYITRFNQELNQLGASGIMVELVKTRAERGRAKHAIKLRNAVTPNAPLAEILSEGERRIISLAAFLADVTGRTTSSPFIFDDPISSLDQAWEERSIDRLIALSQSRQVIIFTHRLSMLGIISDKVEADDLNSVHIRRETWGTGEPGQLPLFGKRPDRALNGLRDDRLARARRTLNEQGHEAYYPLGKAICSDIRILTERIVELVLLADVIQRHRRAVNTMGKIQQLAKITIADCTLIDSIMSKYSAFEHSQPNEAPVELPEPDEISADINRVIAWHTEFNSRRI